MGRRRHTTVLQQLLGSRARALVICRLFEPEGERPWVRDVLRFTGCGAGAAGREIERLISLGLVLRRREGPRCYLDLRRDHALCEPLARLVETERLMGGPSSGAGRQRPSPAAPVPALAAHPEACPPNCPRSADSTRPA